MRESISQKNTMKFSTIPITEQTQARDDIITRSPAKTTGWWEACKQVLPIYIALHIALLALTYLAVLFSLRNFARQALPNVTLINSWDRWDTNQYTYIAVRGYTRLVHTAFFPLYPLMERALALVVHSPFIAGLLISNVAMLGMFMVFYRLVAEDFGPELAWRSVVYLALFPSAFFFAAAYTESPFLLFVILSFYYMRRGRWWLAGLAALIAGLFRSTSICLLVPFAYEYFRQRDFQWRKIRLDILSGIGIVGGVIIFGYYGYVAFHDPLAFSHAQAYWGRHLAFPWTLFVDAYTVISQHPLLTFTSIHTELDLVATLFIMVVLVLSFVGPWKLAREHWSYLFYAVTLFILFILVPQRGNYPLASLTRFMLEIFPAFIVLAIMGKRRNFNLYYLAICGPLLGFMVLQWLTGAWTV